LWGSFTPFRISAGGSDAAKAPQVQILSPRPNLFNNLQFGLKSL